MSVCHVCVCPLRWRPEPRGLESSGQRAYRYYCKNKNFLLFAKVSMIFLVLTFLGFLGFWVFGKPAYCALALALALSGGSVTVAVGVGDRWHVKCDTHMTSDIFLLPKKLIFQIFVSVLLSAHFERFCLRNFQFSLDILVIIFHCNNAFFNLI